MTRVFKSFIYAWNGIRWALSEQLNLKIHFISAIVVIGAGFYFKITEIEWLVIVLALGFVISAELMNSAIESAVNLISPHHQPLAGRIKDIAAGAVLVSVITTIVVGIMIFGKYLF